MFDFSKIKSSLKRTLFGSSPSTSREPNRSSAEEIKSRVAVRYFVKKSKRFSLLNQAIQQKMQDMASIINRKQQATPDCLLYLGLTSRGEKTRDDKRKLLRKDDFEFTKPRIYECDYCTKIFFHKKLYRRHMIKHIKRVQWCNRCHTGFSSRVAKRRHNLTCRR